MGIEGVLNKGFVTTSADTVLNYVRTGSLWPVTFGLACCAVEMMQAGAAQGGCHFVTQGAGHNHQIRLARRGAEDNAEAVEVVARRASLI